MQHISRSAIMDVLSDSGFPGLRSLSLSREQGALSSWLSPQGAVVSTQAEGHILAGRRTARPTRACALIARTPLFAKMYTRRALCLIWFLAAICAALTACQCLRVGTFSTLDTAKGPTRSPAPPANERSFGPTTSPGRWTTFSDVKHVTDMAFDQEGHLWAATLNGVLRWDLEDQSRTEYGVDDGLPSKNVQCIAVAPDGSVWLGTRSAGVSRFDPSAVSRQGGEVWATYTAEDGLVDDRVQDIAVGRDGTLWFATYGGVSRFDSSPGSGERRARWTTYTTANGLAGDRVLSAAVHPDGSLWFGTFGSGVSRFDPSPTCGQGGEEVWATYTTADGLADDRVRAIAVAPHGALWFATFGGGISRYDSGSWITYTTADGLAENVLSCITVASDGTVWIGAADNGISRFDGTSFVRYTAAHGLVDNEIWSVLATPDGTIWASSINGISDLSSAE